MKSIWIGLAAVAAAGLGLCHAAVIGKADFGPGVQTSDYEGLGLSFKSPTPLVIDGNTYETDNGTIRYNSAYGDVIGASGHGMGTDSEAGFVRITFGTVVNRAGVHFGLPGTGTARISFFNGATLLNSFEASTTGPGGGFRGWDAVGKGTITSILIEDLTVNAFILQLDDLYWERARPIGAPVPVPAAALLFAPAVLFAVRRRKAS